MASLLKSSVGSYATFPRDDAPLALPSVSETHWLARATYTHARPLLDAGSQRRVELEDLWPLEAKHQAAASYDKFQRALERTQSVRRALFATVGPSFALCGLGNGVRAACALFAPVVLRQVTDAFSKPVVDVASVYCWVAALFGTRLLNAFLEAHVNFLMEMTLMEMTASLKALVFQKIMRRSLHSKRDANGGSIDVSNIVTADIDNLMWASYSINSAWILPIQICFVIYLLYDVLGLAAFAGLGVIFLSMMLSHFVAQCSKHTFDQLMKFKDCRMQVIKEVFGAIQVIKLNAWEGRFFEQICFWRNKELQAVTRYLYIVAISVFLLWSTPLAVSVTSFAIYALAMDQELTAAKVFTAMVLFNAIRDPLSQFPGALQSCLQASSALDRIAMFLNTTEVTRANVSRDAEKFEKNVEIAVEAGVFSWQTATTRETSSSRLENVSFQICKGDFVVIHGVVGSGKSLLLAALLGEIPAEEGTVFVRSKRIAYYSQQPWIQNMTIRDNILFGLPYDKDRYHRVLDACGLMKDIELLPAGDKTEIGQKGVNLSGGQKARVSLARACYSDADVFILDTPLAAVDAVVQAEIFDKCICDLLKDKTVLLVTHLRDLIESPALDVKIHIEDGTSRVCYSRQTKSRRERGKLSTVLEIIVGLNDGGSTTVAKDTDGQFVEQEGRQGGLVSGQVFRDYVSALGGKKVIAVFVLILALWQTSQIASDVWLSNWTGSTSTPDQPRDAHNLVVYAVLGLVTSFLVLLRALTVAFVGAVAARRLFDDMTRSLLNAPLRFFDTNPIGRILNRYAEDISMIDFRLPPVFFGAFVNSAINAFQLLAAVYVIKSAGLLIVPLCWVYIRLGSFYFAANLEVSRLRKVTTSPILTHIAQSEEGVATLRAFGSSFVAHAHEEHLRRIDNNNRAWYAQTVISQWFALRVQLIGVGVVVIVVSSLVTLHEYLTPGLIALAFMYAMNVDQQLALGLKSWLWLEMYLVSPERVLEYVGILPEGSCSNSVSVDSAWPHQGSLVFENVHFAYKPGGDVILRGLSFRIDHNEKIGIVGRTGAGKSSLTMALFRVNELESGRIVLDGVDISTINLQLLRSRMSIIPQVPVLFKGSLRAYMDPFEEYADANIWAAFEKVGVKDTISALSGKLDYELSENGENFSVGERQLLCLARALLRKSRVVVMDEATASIDVKTEQKLQAMIAREFVDATVLTIAHRLSTVLESDRILVLRDGRVAEFDSPRALACVEGGVFRELAKESGCLSHLLN